jgi:hypothetical protein
MAEAVDPPRCENSHTGSTSRCEWFHRADIERTARLGLCLLFGSGLTVAAADQPRLVERANAAPEGFVPPPLHPDGARLETKQLAPGVYALVSTKPPVDNSGFVVGERGALVIDAHINGAMARQIQAAVRRSGRWRSMSTAASRPTCQVSTPRREPRGAQGARVAGRHATEDDRGQGVPPVRPALGEREPGGDPEGGPGTAGRAA